MTTGDMVLLSAQMTISMSATETTTTAIQLRTVGTMTKGLRDQTGRPSSMLQF